MGKYKKISITIILICGFLLLWGYIRMQDRIKIAYCKVVEYDQDKILLKQSSGIDQSLYDSINIYFIIDRKNIDKFDALVVSNIVDLNKEIQLIFRYNKIFDFTREGDKVFFNIREIVEII